MAERLATGATNAIRWTKTAVNIGLKQIAHSVMDASISYEMLTFATNDHREAVEAFQEKRNPTFHGA
jgi:enoyl-CoA hydratase